MLKNWVELGKQIEKYPQLLAAREVVPFVHVIPSTRAHSMGGVRGVGIVPFRHGRYECPMMRRRLKALLRSPSLGQSQGNWQVPWDEAPHC